MPHRLTDVDAQLRRLGDRLAGLVRTVLSGRQRADPDALEALRRLSARSLLAFLEECNPGASNNRADCLPLRLHDHVRLLALPQLAAAKDLAAGGVDGGEAGDEVALRAAEELIHLVATGSQLL